MSRYLYRAKRIDNGEWVYGGLFHTEDITDGNTLIVEHTVEGKNHYIDYKTIGQCTGLKDKNGTLIYEGDVVMRDNRKHDDCNQSDNVHVIYWNKHWNSWAYRAIKWTCSTPLYTDEVKVLEIIGNVHDNADLLD